MVDAQIFLSARLRPLPSLLSIIYLNLFLLYSLLSICYQE
jgi:hypothetical protein